MVKIVKNVISVDVEQWFHTFTARRYVKNINVSSTSLDYVVKATRKLLDLFEDCDKITTFFVLGEVAEHLPELVKEIGEKGHEVAFHGYSHLRLHELGPSKFQEEVEMGATMLRQISKQKILGFRAPDFSLNNETVWALGVLNRKGFKYDSSLFPTITPQYGLYTATCRPYIPSSYDLTKENLSQSIVEFPMLIRRIGPFKVPAAGGFYLRLFGPKFIVESIRDANRRGYPAMCYIHSWEVYGFPKVELPIPRRFYAYHKVPCLDHFEKLVKNVDVAPAIEVLEAMGI